MRNTNKNDPHNTIKTSDCASVSKTLPKLTIISYQQFIVILALGGVISVRTVLGQLQLTSRERERESSKHSGRLFISHMAKINTLIHKYV